VFLKDYMLTNTSVLGDLSSVREWEELVSDLAQELGPALRKWMYRGHYDRARSLSSPSEKLIYFHLLHTQPQTFTGVRRALSLGKSTVDRGLQHLLEKGYIVLDETYLYWVSE